MKKLVPVIFAVFFLVLSLAYPLSVGAASPRYGVACIQNNTGGTLKIQHRWTDSEEKDRSHKPSVAPAGGMFYFYYQYPYGSSKSEQLQIIVNNTFLGTYFVYTPERYQSTTASCDRSSKIGQFIRDEKSGEIRLIPLN